MNCTEITFLDLCPESKSILGAQEYNLDVPLKGSVRLSKDVIKLSVLNEITAEGALGFSVPFSEVNDAIFIENASPVTVDNRRKKYKVSVRVAGQTCQFDQLELKRKNETTQEWEVELQRSESHWIDLANKTFINTLDYGSFTMSRSAILANWDQSVYEGDYRTPNDGQRPYLFPVIDYGGWVDQTEPPQGQEGKRVKTVAVEDVRPLVSFPYILQAGFCAFGWTLDGVIFESDWMKRKWAYVLRPDYHIASKRGGRITGRRFERKKWDNVTLQYMTFDELSEGLPAWEVPGDLAGIKNITGAALKFRFQMQGEFHNDRALPFTAVFGIFELTGDDSLYTITGEIISAVEDNLVIEFVANEKKIVVLDMTVVLKPGQMGIIHIGETPGTDGFYIEPGMNVRITPANDSLMTDDIVKVSECVSDKINVLQCLKALFQMCNMRAYPDFDTKTLTIYPDEKANLFGDTIPGFLLEEEPAEDINNILVVDSIQTIPVKQDLKRYTRFEFLDSSDAYIDSLNLLEPAHSRKILNGLEYPDQVESIQNPLFEPTLEGQPNGISPGFGVIHLFPYLNALPYLPRLWDNTTGQRSFSIGPRILHAYGNVKQVNPNPLNSANFYSSFFFDSIPNLDNDGLAETFCYVSQLPTWQMLPDPEVKQNVVFGTQNTDLFTIFWLGFSQASKYGSTLDVLLFIRMTDYVNENFRRLKTFNIGGIPIRAALTAYRDFDGCDELPTPATFSVPPAETACCDLPCGCQFSTCEYYQDFGIFMRQSTLNDLKVSSFVVDGKELLTSPVSFGNIKMIDMNGYRYVMNMVDTLNSIGAPYFSFDISERVDGTRGKRFFKIKHLLCIPFKILITNDGEEVYKYTQDEQKTKWFSGDTWEDFGYSPNFYGEPIDCVTTTEY